MITYDPADPIWSADPWPGYEEIRRRAPVHRSPLGFWVVARHADCLAVLRDRRASADGRNALPGGEMPDGLGGAARTPELQELLEVERENRPFLFLDPPDHTRLRGLVSSAFTPRMVESLRGRTEELVSALIDAALDRGQVDLVADFAYPLPVQIICELLGVPAVDRGHFVGWSAALARGLDPDFLLSDEVIRARFAAIASFAEYFFPLLAERRQRPGDDLLSALAVAEDAGGGLSEGEMLSTAILLLVAGHETTVNLLAGGMAALSEHPAQAAGWRDQPGLSRTAVEELLRYVSPVQLTGRTSTDDMEVGGSVFGRGEQALLLLGSANRDPDAFDAPNRLNLEREPNRHLGFGFGIHHCLGAPLARLEAQVALPALLRRAGVIEIDTTALRYRPNVVLRGLEALPARIRAR